MQVRSATLVIKINITLNLYSNLRNRVDFSVCSTMSVVHYNVRVQKQSITHTSISPRDKRKFI